MSVKSLDTSGFTDATQAASDAISAFNETLKTMQSVTNAILDSWVGKGRNEFATQVSLINGKLGDISDELYDLYDAIVQAEKTYIDADQALAKEMSIKGE